MDLFSTPFDKTSVDMLEKLHVPAYKIASLEINHLPLIKYVASKKKPVIISTGIAGIEDIDLALSACKEVGNENAALLKCTSAYPTPLEEVNLKTIPFLENKYDCVIGLSDHTMSTTVPVAAVTLGARIVEKHFILDRNLGGIDSEFSLNKTEFKEMVTAIRDVEKALGKEKYEITEKMELARVSARSIIVVKDIKAGEVFTEQNIKILRPGYGMEPKYFDSVLGRKSKHDISRGTPLNQDHLD
jgi:pseudaminic acid synthase